jgi:hypothetical protein
MRAPAALALGLATSARSARPRVKRSLHPLRVVAISGHSFKQLGAAATGIVDRDK